MRRELRAGRSTVAAEAETLTGAVLFTDLSGFTRLTEELSRGHPTGAEEVKQLLDQCFGPLVDVIDEFGGEIVRFTGDGTLVLFRAGEEGLAEATARATACGLGAVEGQEVLGRELALRLRASVAAGSLWSGAAGGTEGRFEAVLGGAALRELGAADARARPGEVVLTDAAWDQLESRVIAHPLGEGFHRVEGFPDGTPTLAVEAGPELATEGWPEAFVPRALRARLAAGPTEWLAEFRQVTVLFIGLHSLNEFSALQDAFLCVQGEIYAAGGSISQLVIDEKGPTVVAGFGLSQHQHEDDAVRALRAAERIERDLKESGVECSIGVTTGRVFTGTRGGKSYRDLAMIGDAVNLASRLMDASGGRIVCDAATRRSARRDLRFDALRSLTVKGRSEAVAVYRPVAARERALPGRTPLVGRSDELDPLLRQLRRLERDSGSHVVLVEGPPGIGKTRLVQHLLEATQASHVRSLLVSGDALAQGTPYKAWLPALEREIGIEGVRDAKLRSERVLQRLGRTGGRDPRAAVLNELLGLVLPASPIERAMRTDARALATRELLAQLLHGDGRDGPTLLVVEDGHWIDSGSWALVEALFEQLQPMLLVIATRPLPSGQRPAEFERLTGPGSQHIPLEGLPLEDAVQLACQHLDVDSLPEPVVDLLWRRGEGHPLYTEELASALRDRGHLRVEDGECILLCDPEELEDLELPLGIQGLVTGRIDLLGPEEQLTVKVASVLGHTFDLEALHAVHPADVGQNQLQAHLEALERLDLVRALGPEEPGRYRFKHALTADVTYELLSFAQRRELHGRIAEWLEARSEAAAGHDALLAHHWSSAEVSTKALDSLERAGTRALEEGLFPEAAGFLARAHALLDTDDSQPRHSARRVRVERQLGECHLGLGNTDQAKTHLEHALRGTIFLPRTRGEQLRSLAGQVLRQLGHRLRPGGPAPADPNQAPRLREAADALYWLTSIHFLNQAPLPWFHAAFASVNLAEKTEPSTALVHGYVAVHSIASLFGLARVARSYEARALHTARLLGSPLALAETLFGAGVIHHAMGRVQLARGELHLAQELFNRFGGTARSLDSISTEAYAAFAMADHERAQYLYTQLLARAEGDHAARHKAWAQVWSAGIALRQGRSAEALALATDAEAASEQAGDLATEISRLGFLAQAQLLEGRERIARDQADRALATAGALSGPGATHVLDGLMATTEVYHDLWELEGDDVDAEIRSDARAALRQLRRFAGRLRIAAPAAEYARGRNDQLRGRRRRATRRFRRAAALAAKMSLPFEEGLARLALGRVSRDEEARAELERARAIFQRLGAARHQAQCEAALSSVG